MKICHFTYSFYPLVGGMEEVIHSLCLAQLKCRHAPAVLAPRVRGADNQLDVPYPVQRFSRPSSKRYFIAQLLIPLLTHYWRHKFEILHCHSCHPPGTAARWFSKLTGVPVVLTSHGGDIEYDAPGVIGTPAITKAISKNLADANAVTAISKQMQNQLFKLSTSPDNIHYVPNGVWINEFRPKRSYLDRRQKADPPYLAFLGRLIHRKGADLLLNAFSDLIDDYPDIRLKIGGSGNAEKDLRALVKRLKIERRVDFLGTVRGEEKIELLQNALGTVFPSRSEPFGVVALEAMAAGTPVVAAKAGGFRDIIEDRKTGMLFAVEDLGQLTECCRQLLDNPDLAASIAQSAASEVKNYNWRSIAGQYKTVYDNALAARQL